ncbi:hypothetical protein UFOVP229_27 [uncultured Caudovirales phage]|uniref:Uncharacterized protein n=1 Tax=uncultured Caudovirales phage TaxID=2100421 RepID=A0A6J7WV28_9CAUD|nr:hypothetical protein UFOVP229_27 [uncultured Caudovirales phage]
MNSEVSTYRLNCRPGDLAVVVRSVAGNEGKVVTCLRLHPPGTDNTSVEDGPVWEIDRPLVGVLRSRSTGEVFGRVSSPYMPDKLLRPLRGDVAEDEAQREAEAV